MDRKMFVDDLLRFKEELLRDEYLYDSVENLDKYEVYDVLKDFALYLIDELLDVYLKEK